MQAQQAILTFNEADRSLGARLLKIAIEIDRVEGYSEPHAIAIAWTAEKIGARMGLHGIDLTALKFAALAHDLGERAMKRNYLLRPSELSWEETLDLWRHPILGEQAASELKLPRQTQLLIRWHHEWWNGGGYPDGLAGEAIPPGARILRAVDSYFALISERPHRRRFDRIEAEQIIADLAGIEFDPQVAKLLLQVLAEEVGEGGFIYPAPGRDESATRPIEDQPQPVDEVVYASAYANRQAETPAESLSGGQALPAGFASSIVPPQAPDNVMEDEAGIESSQEIVALDLASSKTIGEAGGEIPADAAGADFAAPPAIEEEALESPLETHDGDLVLSESSEAITFQEQLEMARDDLSPLDLPGMLGETEAESRTETPAVDFSAPTETPTVDFSAPTETPAVDFSAPEAPGAAGDQFQPEMAGVETSKTREKKEEIES